MYRQPLINKSFFATLFFVALLSFSTHKPVHAQQLVLDACRPEKGWFDTLASKLDAIRLTTVDHWTSLMFDGLFTSVNGVTLTELRGCDAYFEANYPGLDIPGDCSGTPDIVCQAIANQYYKGDVEGAGYNYNMNNPIGGSLLGMTNYIQASIEHSPIPVNFAYFFQDSVSKIPIVGDKVMAQVNYRQPFIEPILNVWKVTRNVAFALMSLIMLYIGITIITRKKISQQTVVTVQYALPKVVIAIIMIAFSYPIGALLASFGWSMYNSAPLVAKTLFNAVTSSGDVWLDFAENGLGIGIASLIGGILAAGFALPMVGTLLVAVSVTLAVLGFIFYISVLITYLKMIVGIASAPIEMALYAIPGNDDKLAGWFKKMGVYGLALFAMGGIRELVDQFAHNIINGMNTGGLDNITNVLMRILAPFLVYLFGYGLALSMPKKIEAAVMGPPKRR